MVVIFTNNIEEVNGEVQEDNLRLTIGNPNGDIEAEQYFIGQFSTLSLEATFGTNVMSYGFGIIGNHPFLYFDNATTIDEVEAGWKVSGCLEIDPNVQLGIYEFLIFLNYTNHENEFTSKSFNLDLEIVNPWEVVEISIPTGNERKISVEVETFISISNLTMKYSSEGDIGFEQEIFLHDTAPPGRYIFETNLIWYNDTIFEGDQYFYYHLHGNVSDIPLEILESDIPFNIEWTDEEKGLLNDDDDDDDSSDSNTFWFIVILTFTTISILLVAIIISFHFKGKNAKY